MLTVQILLRNNKETIGRALDSVSGMGRIVVGNLGSNDGSLDICSAHGAEIVEVGEKNNDFSLIRNGLSGDGINFYLEAWEFVARGKEEIVSSDGARQVCVIGGGVASKETRIWQGRKGFINPVYETIIGPSHYDPRIVVVSASAPNLIQEKRELTKKWLDSRPTACEPYYYMACTCLYERKYDEFFFYAKKYMAMERNHGTESVLLCYYMAQIELHTGRLSEASSHILFCLSVRPMMAEFWCLLGDMFYRQNKFGKAKSMYENAIIIGRSRKNSDPYPVEISKYKEYPEKMMGSIDEISSDILERMKKAETGQ